MKDEHILLAEILLAQHRPKIDALVGKITPLLENQRLQTVTLALADLFAAAIVMKAAKLQHSPEEMQKLVQHETKLFEMLVLLSLYTNLKQVVGEKPEPSGTANPDSPWSKVAP